MGRRREGDEVVEEGERDEGVEREGDDPLGEERSREGRAAGMVAGSGGAHGTGSRIDPADDG